MKIDPDLHREKIRLVAQLSQDRLPWWRHWRDLADYILPKRYNWLLSENERKDRMTKNPNILDGTGTMAARTLAAGMMNGITSPSRPWVKLKLAGYDFEEDHEVQVWLDEVTRRMLRAMAETNFYNALAVAYLDLVVFGTASMMIYEDPEEIFCCYNNPLGEFYLGLDEKMQVAMVCRNFHLTVYQVVKRWGYENCSDRVKNAYDTGRTQDQVEIWHLLEPNDPKDKLVPKMFKYRDIYWEAGKQAEGQVLAKAGYHEMPGIFPRWEVTGNDAYGTSPGMDALADIIQLQHETKRKAQSLDYMVMPPTLADISLKNKPTAMLPGKTTFVSGLNAGGVGVKPAYQFTPNIQELTMDIREVQGRIKEIFHNDLFMMISQLDTVRTATEIDARREEKLVLLGSVLERFGNEALDRAITRIFNIMHRAGLFPPAPKVAENETIEIQYTSILSAAQLAVGVAPTERFLGLVGNIVAVRPEVGDIPNYDELLRDYARDTGVKAKGLNSREAVAAKRAQDAQMQQAAQAAEIGKTLSEGAKNLSATDVGGGANVLQQLMGG